MQPGPRHVSHDRNRLGESGECCVPVDVADIERHPEQPGRTRQPSIGLVAESTVVSGDELEAAFRHRSLAIVGRMRPATALVVVGLLALIVGAFLWQIYSSGASP